MRSIELFGTEVAPLVREGLARRAPSGVMVRARTESWVLGLNSGPGPFLGVHNRASLPRMSQRKLVLLFALAVAVAAPATASAAPTVTVTGDDGNPVPLNATAPFGIARWTPRSLPPSPPPTPATTPSRSSAPTTWRSRR